MEVDIAGIKVEAKKVEANDESQVMEEKSNEDSTPNSGSQMEHFQELPVHRVEESEYEEDSGIEQSFESSPVWVRDVSLNLQSEESDGDDEDYEPSFSESENSEEENSISRSIENVIDAADKRKKDFQIRPEEDFQIQREEENWGDELNEDERIGNEGNKDIEADEDEDNEENNPEDIQENPNQQLISKLEKMGKRHAHGHKGHACTYCGEVYVKLPRHLEQRHRDESEVKEALSYPEKSKERNRKWVEIRREGDFKINIDAYQQNLTPQAVRNGKTVKEKLPCDGCKGFFDSRRLSKHAKKCFFKKDDVSSHSAKSARVFLAMSAVDGKYGEVHKKIISGIKDKTLSLIIRNDELLLALGAVELDNKESVRYHDIRYTLRTMAKVIIEFRTVKRNINVGAIDLVQPGNYDDLIITMKKLSGYKGRTSIENPHLVMKIGFSIRTLTLLAKLIYTKSEASESIKKMKMMITLYTEDYTNYSNNAKDLYEVRKGNAPEELPLESDLKKIREAHLHSAPTSSKTCDVARG